MASFKMRDVGTENTTTPGSTQLISPSPVLSRALVTNMNRLTTNQSWKVYNYD